MTTKQGDFLLLNYTLKVKESGETVDTTYDAVAKDAHIHREDGSFKPRFIILGEGWMPKGLEESLVGVSPGKQTTVELTPEKGFGARDPGKIRLVPLRRFREKGVDPVPGRQIELDGRQAMVRAVGAGRVQVDYNHPLAGRTLIYDISIEKVLEDEKEKILNIISLRIPEVDNSKFNLHKSKEELTIDVPEEAFYLSGLQVAKKSITSDLQKYMPDLDTVSFREVFKRTEPKPETTTESTPTTPKTGEPRETKEGKESKTEGTSHEKTGEGRKRRPARTSKRPPVTGARKRAKMGSENQR
jgi:peptidylprolyl isomerase